MTANYIARWMIADIGTLDQVAFASKLPIQQHDEFSLSFWLYATQAKSIQVIISVEGLFQLRLENDKLVFEMFSHDKSVLLSSVFPELGRWHHVAALVGDIAKLYVDGELVESRAFDTQIEMPFEGELLIGGYTDPAGGHFDHTFGRNQSGLVDDVRWYATQLSEEKIAQFISQHNKLPDIQIDFTMAAGGLVDFAANCEQTDAFHTYLWDFGDSNSSIGAQVSHDYAFSGEYLVRLMAVSNSYQQIIREQLITVDKKVQAPQVSPVFVNGTEGYACYRIPSIVRAANGHLVAFAEARLESCSDSTDTIRLVCKRSSDNGKTWSALQIVAKNIVNEQEYVVQNSAPVVDTIHKTGRMIVLYNKMEHSEWELAKGIGISRIFCIFSDDNGMSWYNETDITTLVHRPPQWRVQRPTIGHALQLSSGRLLFVGVFSDDKGSVFQSQNYVFWSDDLGTTWKIGGIVPQVGLNEAIALELENGSIMINSRAYLDEKSVGRRAVTIGHFPDTDTIEFDPTYFDETLIDPAVQASIIRYTASNQLEYGGKSRLLFVNPNHPQARYNLTVRLSYDEGKTWAISKTIDPSQSAYSDLVIQDDMRIGVLYEHGNQGGISYTNFTLDWLTDGQDELGA